MNTIARYSYKGGRAKAKASSKGRKIGKAGRFIARTKYKGYKRGAQKAYKFNKRHKIIGPDPRYMVSPFEAIPFLGQYAEARKLQQALEALERGVDEYYSRRRYGHKRKSRGSRKSSSSRRNVPRGKYKYRRYYKR